MFIALYETNEEQDWDCMEKIPQLTHENTSCQRFEDRADLKEYETSSGAFILRKST